MLTSEVAVMTCGGMEISTYSCSTTRSNRTQKNKIRERKPKTLGISLYPVERLSASFCNFSTGVAHLRWNASAIALVFSHCSNSREIHFGPCDGQIWKISRVFFRSVVIRWRFDHHKKDGDNNRRLISMLLLCSPNSIEETTQVADPISNLDNNRTLKSNRINPSVSLLCRFVLFSSRIDQGGEV
ncbi:unnamed protein product [Linum trigynum]|uniref:Uncharacterized protein n=1 Tax=Linum trigynum TaxID=586398 RepID=A0AAV2E0F5_9ROSI